MNTCLSDYIEKSFVVLLHESYEFGDWFWFPEMTAEELETWWNSQENFKTFLLDPQQLPGVVFNTTDLGEEPRYLEMRLSGRYYKADIEGPMEARLEAPTIAIDTAVNVAA